MNTIKHRPLCLAIAALWGLHGAANAQLVINENLKGATSNYDWISLNGACLTAGNLTRAAVDLAGKGIPGCDGLAYYQFVRAGVPNRPQVQVGGVSGRLPDQVGQGALRLTNGGNQAGGQNGDDQNGAVVSNFTFPKDNGVDIRFTTRTYGGDGGGGTGADGISFFLSDGSIAPSVGGLGGSLGYSCSNINRQYDGVIGGYLGIGIDEYRNFANPSDNTDSGPGQRPGRISVRGAGSTAFSELNRLYPALYPNSLSDGDKRRAVWLTCSTGRVWDVSGELRYNNTTENRRIINAGETTQTLPFNYRYLAPQEAQAPAPLIIANQQNIDMPLRADAVPITYAIKITRDGILDFSYSVNGGTTRKVIRELPITRSNGPLPDNFRFGFAAATGGASNVHEITCFKAAEISQTNSSAGGNTRQSSRVQAGTQAYFASYDSSDWSGRLSANTLLVNETTGALSIAADANWDASCTLTGGACPAMATNTPAITATPPAERQILTWDPERPQGSRGIPFEWQSLSAAQRTALQVPGSAAQQDDRLEYLRGSRSLENQFTPEGVATGFRTRRNVLGDIVSSSPTWVGAPDRSYGATFSDKLYPSATGSETSYATFKTGQATRPHMVYVGANDGMLHGFRAGGNNAQGQYATTDNDGREMLAYMPEAVLSTIRTNNADFDFSNLLYSHNFYVDATPGTGDLFVGGEWRTWLVSGLGAGGNASGPVGTPDGTTTGAIFALDITNPSEFSQANAASLVKGEWNSSNLACANDTQTNLCRNSLGGVHGTPIIRRLHNGSWAALFGNGLNSSSGKAGLFIMLMNPTSGAITFRFLETNVGTNTSVTPNVKNGISYVTSADLDSDRIADYVYAGDVRGNLWRFDLTSNDPANWSASSSPLFTTPNGQPITSRVTGAPVPAAGSPRLMIAFGTGRQTPQTTSSAETYVAGTQAMYGIWDSNFGPWNTRPATANDRYASVSGNWRTLQASDLTEQTVSALGSSTTERTVSRNVVCWAGSTTCGAAASSNNKYGWKLDLPAGANQTVPGEQIIYNPVIESGLLFVNTVIPGNTSSLDCERQLPTGYTMAVTLAGGAAPEQSVFADANGLYSSGANGEGRVGIATNGTGSVSFVVTSDSNGRTRPWLYTQTNGGNRNGSGSGSNSQVIPPRDPPGKTLPPNLPKNTVAGRVNWIKLR